MKTILSLLSASFAIALAACLAADFAGALFARSIDALGLLSGFAACLVALLLTSDYRRASRRGTIGEPATRACAAKANHPLAA